jgi:hypothetical protein
MLLCKIVKAKKTYETKLKASCTIIETPVDLKIIIGKYIFVLDKIDQKWSAIGKELVKEV